MEQQQQQQQQQRKAVDSRIPTLIRNGVQERKRSFFVVVGDRAKDVIVHLHYIMSSMNMRQNKSVLWAYKKNLLGFSSNRRKREAKIRREVRRGTRDPNLDDPFELFVTLHSIRYVFYKETENILGNTYGMCILQDFEAVTPNTLARCVETVEGGGLVVLLLRGMTSLKQLYNLSMDVHSRYRTEAHHDVVARFNERFILSLGGCEACLVIDDELNVLPISGGKAVRALPAPGALPETETEPEPPTPAQRELADLKESLRDTRPVGPLVALASTIDQARALLTFVDAISEKTLRSTVALTAARGRGKSAAMGVAVAAAVAYGYSNIFITSPSPDNLRTLFEFVFRGFDALGYADHADYSIIQSTNPDFNRAVVRVNIHRQHRQTIQYIRPQDGHVLGQAELVVIDEAAAIPLPLVRGLLGPHLVFMASTVNGYEGTGRSLSLKLIKQLREQSSRPDGAAAEAAALEVADRSTGKTASGMDAAAGLRTSRTLREITLSTPIRYAPGDPVEKWLNGLLCLDAASALPRLGSGSIQGCPDPARCELLRVNRDTLFSFHPVSERFLQRMVALFVASHYKNTPDDLQLMSDAPAHELFVLVPPTADADEQDKRRLPEPLCVVQVCLEGKIGRQSILNGLSRGHRAHGDLIPWLVSQQFQDEDFGSLSGARVVRIATNPDFVSMGYGGRALQLLVDYYDGRFRSISEEEDDEGTDHHHTAMPRETDADLAGVSLLLDEVAVRDIAKMPPLFSRLTECRPARLDYVGVSFGLTPMLHKFWKRASFAPVYLRQTPNDLTGEHSCVMLRALDGGGGDDGGSDKTWLGAFARDFGRRFLSLLSYQFRTFSAVAALSIEESAGAGARLDGVKTRPLTRPDLDAVLSPFDLKRLESYANGMLDYHVVMDLLPRLAELYFGGPLRSEVSLTGVQQCILLAVGLQRRDMDEVARDLAVPNQQLLAMFMKMMRKVTAKLGEIVARAAEAEMAATTTTTATATTKAGGRLIGVSRENASGAHDDEPVNEQFEPLDQPLAEELDEGGDEALRVLREKQRELIDSLPLDRYEIEGDAPGWEEAERQVLEAAGSGRSKTVVSIRAGEGRKKKEGKGGGKRKAAETAAEIYEEVLGEKKEKKGRKKQRRGEGQ